MRIPTIQGIIDRRMLINYQVDPAILANILPYPFQPKIINGVGIAGVCLIRLKAIRPNFIPLKVGFSSENAAHRIAIQWKEGDRLREGVYIPRRDTSSRVNTLIGGRLFPGLHQYARFEVTEHQGHFRVALESEDGQTRLCVEARLASDLPAGSVFESLEEASHFFEAGSLGYSATPEFGKYDSLELRTFNWKVEPLAIDRVASSFFENPQLFPRSAIKFDCALLMRGIRHEWHGQAPLCLG
jgi:hypothetical protein